MPTIDSSVQLTLFDKTKTQTERTGSNTTVSWYVLLRRRCAERAKRREGPGESGNGSDAANCFISDGLGMAKITCTTEDGVSATILYHFFFSFPFSRSRLPVIQGYNSLRERDPKFENVS